MASSYRLDGGAYWRALNTLRMALRRVSTTWENVIQPLTRNRGAAPVLRDGDHLGSGYPILLAAAQRVIGEWHDRAENGVSRDAIAELTAALTIAIHRCQQDPTAPIDERLRTVLGRRLLDQLRSKVVLGWNGAPATEMKSVLVAIERVREATETTVLDNGQKMQGIEMLAEVAHDLQSPLTSILFLADTLQRGQSGPISELQRWQLGLIYGAALGLSTVTSDMIELVQKGDHLLEKDPVPLSITALFEGVQEILRPVAEEKGLALRFQLPAVDHRLGHPVALTRVLLNLATNALKFTDRGFVELVAKELDETRIEFSVTDSGRGIDPSVLDRLAHPFQRNPTQRGYGFSGTRLGLTICRKLLDAMGSDLRGETEQGKGTRFFFELALPATKLPLRFTPIRERLRRATRDRRGGAERRVSTEQPIVAERRSGTDRRGVGSVAERRSGGDRRTIDSTRSKNGDQR